ncbi:MAG: hypothetical protein C0496_18765 [Erythrobacter sp.]|nr:hypothetical protein [Erythrobacter sp.]
MTCSFAGFTTSSQRSVATISPPIRFLYWVTIFLSSQTKGGVVSLRVRLARCIEKRNARVEAMGSAAGSSVHLTIALFPRRDM